MERSFVVLIGRPNVGKSTLFNRLIGERLSVVDDRPGTTRDRVQAIADWRGMEFTIVDTGGLEPLESLRSGEQRALAEASTDFVHEIRDQVEVAIAEADIIIFVTDAQTGLTGADEAVADILRKQIGQRQKAGKHIPPVLVAANKTETTNARDTSPEFYRLGLGDVYPISGMYGEGTGDLLDAVVQLIPEQSATPPDESIKISLVGRPNVGKSSLFNQLIGESRVIVSDIPGTTRDAIDTRIEIKAFDASIAITLIDTAGIRKRGTIEVGVEKYSVLRAFKAIERADVALLLIDAVDGITAQDEHIAGYILDANKSAVLIINKWDTIESAEKVERIAKPVKGLGMLTEKMQVFMQNAQTRFNFMAYAPVLFVSAKTGFRCDQILPTAVRVYEARNMRIPTSDVNRILREATEKHAPPTKGSKRLKIFYGSQVGTNPPTFLFHVNDTELMHFSYRRYLENAIRDEFGFLGTPIRLSFRGRREDG
ncbi:MAG: ribosome biogenesis GTPase Der [Chloroflexi bacterium]|nr:ribosome biogenesis GTPase Der [Chloroflexota bacterium]